MRKNKNKQSKEEIPSEESGDLGGDVIATLRAQGLSLISLTRIQVVVLSITCALVLMVSVFSVVYSKETVFFQVDDQHRVQPLVPLNNPKHGNAFVVDWANKCLVETFDFYYKQMDKHLSSMKSQCYTENGYRSLITALKESGNYEAIKEKELYSSLALETPVVVRTKSDKAAAYKWLVQAEGSLTLSTRTRDFPNRLAFTVVVKRSSLLEDNIGLSIEKILIKNASRT